MKDLMDTLDDVDSHVHNPNWEAFYKTVERTFGGVSLTIDVEIYHDWEDGIKDYAIVPLGMLLPHGFSIQPDAVLILTEAEIQDFNRDSDVLDYIKECKESAEDIEHHNRYYDASR